MIIAGSSSGSQEIFAIGVDWAIGKMTFERDNK